MPSNLPILKSCRKSGSWIRSNVIFARKYRWTSKPRPYFPNFPDLNKCLTISSNLIESVDLLKISNCYISRDPYHFQSLNIYQSKLHFRGRGRELSDALLFDISGGESFQHFVQDCLPILTLIEAASTKLVNVPILLPKPTLSFKSSYSYLEALELKNSIEYIDSNSSFFVRNLYLFDFRPFNAIYGLPESLYLNAYQRIKRSSPTSNKERTVLLIERSEKSRNFKDVGFVKAKIENWANSHGYTFETIDTSSKTFEEIKATFGRAQYIFAIHGGANYNIIWSNSDVTFIEFIPADATDSVLPLALSFGMRYLPYALNHNKGDLEFDISKSDLDSIFETLGSSNL